MTPPLTHRTRCGEPAFSYQPPFGHRLADIVIAPTGERRAVCECARVFPWADTAIDACEHWRVHTGVGQ